jgi:hypothetical protein
MPSLTAETSWMDRSMQPRNPTRSYLSSFLEGRELRRDSDALRRRRIFSVKSLDSPTRPANNVRSSWASSRRASAVLKGSTSSEAFGRDADVLRSYDRLPVATVLRSCDLLSGNSWTELTVRNSALRQTLHETKSDSPPSMAPGTSCELSTPHAEHRHFQT